MGHHHHGHHHHHSQHTVPKPQYVIVEKKAQVMPTKKEWLIALGVVVVAVVWVICSHVNASDVSDPVPLDQASITESQTPKKPEAPLFKNMSKKDIDDMNTKVARYSGTVSGGNTVGTLESGDATFSGGADDSSVGAVDTSLVASTVTTSTTVTSSTTSSKPSYVSGQPIPAGYHLVAGYTTKTGKYVAPHLAKNKATTAKRTAKTTVKPAQTPVQTPAKTSTSTSSTKPPTVTTPAPQTSPQAPVSAQEYDRAAYSKSEFPSISGQLDPNNNTQFIQNIN